ncbi:MAG TPA: aminotransferase class V-fold PLP-dependent enzyme [Thermomicrobiales bacterium]|nr:aminotransferase class V-fold PLP-dependent enzyme [Thermomicrobiales bacterium]
MSIDIERARRETPGCETVLHFNNAGSSLMPAAVLDAQIEHLQLEARIGGYESADAAHDKVERMYDAAATLIGAGRDEIAAIENATRAWDMAFYSIPFESGDRILTAKAEYASNYIAYLQVAEKYGATVEVVPNDEHGQLSIEHLQAMIDDRVKLIAVTHVPTNGGLVNPAAEIGEVARQAGVLYLLDACQSVGQLPVDVEAFGCDMLSTTGRKYLRGPRGTGFLYVRRSILEQLEPVMLDLHAAQWTSRNTFTIRDDARRFENWETNYAAKIGLGVALDYALDWGIDSIWGRIQLLAGQLRQNLIAIPGVTVRDIGEVQGGIVTFTIEGRDLQEVKDALSEQAINVTVSRTPSTRLDMEERELREVVRASVHYYNSEDEVSRFCAAIEAQA